MVSYHNARDGVDAQGAAMKGTPMIPPDRRMPPKLASSVRKVNLITPSELLDRVDNYRRTRPDLPNRSEAIRKLIEMGLEAAERGKPKGKGKP
jgi:hypothetical protein